MTQKSLAEAIRSARDQQRLTRAELAEMVGVKNVTTVQRWESGESIPERKHQRKLMEILVLDASLFEDAEKAVQMDTEQSPHSYWHVPRRNPLFTGRDDTLSILHAALASGTTAALTQAQAMCGLGGIGKTQIAVEYVYRYSDDYEAIFWIRADSPGSLISDYTDLAVLLDVPTPDEANQDYLVRAVKRWLREHTNWLLIFDNVNDFKVACNFLPTMKHGHVLVTTRAQDTGGIAKNIEIEKMPQDEGALLLLRRAGLLASDDPLDRASKADVELARHISDVMYGLPLALVQAGAYIRATGCDMAGYLDRYEKQRAKLLGRRDELNADYPESVATTWSLSFERVEQASAAAADLLRLCAYFYAEAIPEEMIIDAAHHLGPFLQAITDEIQLDDCIGTLRRYSFIQRNTQNKTFSIHRLVQAVQIDSMEQETQRIWAGRAVYAVNRAFPYVEVGTQQGQRYFLHAQACCLSIKQWHLTSLEAAQLLHKTGRYLREASQYAEAEPFCQDSLELYEHIPQAPKIELSHCCSDLALISEWRGKFAEAEAFYERAWSLCEGLYGTEHPETAAALSNLGLFYSKQGKYSQAEPRIKEALEVRIKTLGADHPQVANSRNCLAELYTKRGKDTEAEQLYKQVLDLYERTLGTEHPRVANVLNNLAGLYEHQGRLDQAEPLCQRALAIYEQQFGPEHHYLAYPLNTLAVIYEGQRKTSEAEALLKKALAIREHTLGTEHPEVAATLKHLALVYKAAGRLQEAGVLFQRALAILEQTAGPEHPHLINVLSLLTLISLDQHKEEEAERLTGRLLAIAAQLQGLEYLKVINDLIIIGTFYLDHREYARARSLYERVLTTAEKILGPDSPTIVPILINLADVDAQQGDDLHADWLYHRALQVIEKQGRFWHPDALKLLQRYAPLMRKMHRDKEAEMLESLMEIIRGSSAQS